MNMVLVMLSISSIIWQLQLTGKEVSSMCRMRLNILYIYQTKFHHNLKWTDHNACLLGKLVDIATINAYEQKLFSVCPHTFSTMCLLATLFLFCLCM